MKKRGVITGEGNYKEEKGEKRKRVRVEVKKMNEKKVKIKKR